MANVPEPKTREELYLAKAAGKSVDTPTPETRLEMYLDAISQGGGGGGGGDLPSGGDAGDILAKKSSAAGDAGWIKPPYTKEQTDDLLAEKAELSVGKISTAGGGEEVHATVSQGTDTVGLNYYKQGQEAPDYINLNVGDDFFTFETRDGIRKQIAQKPSMSIEPEDNTVTFGTDTELFSVTEETDDVLIQMAIPGEYETGFRVPKSEHVGALLSGKQDIMQFSIVPEASADNEGKVIQFVGATSQTFRNGFFYRCQEVTPSTDPKTFEWVRVDVQPAGGGGAGVGDATVYRYPDGTIYAVRNLDPTTGEYDGGNEVSFSKTEDGVLITASKDFNEEFSDELASKAFVDAGLDAKAGKTEIPFVATYESTTYEEVKAAIDANRAIVVNFPNNNNLICVTYATYTTGQRIVMSGIYKDDNDIYATSVWLTPANAWSISNFTLQGKLVSGLNIKTVNNQSILGSGNVDVSVVFNAGTDYPYATMAAALRQGNVFINDGSVNHPVIYFQDDSSESTLYIFAEGGLQGSPSQVCYRWIAGEYQEKTEKYIVPTGGRPGQVLTKNSTSIGDYGWADASGGADAVIIDPDNFTMTKVEFEQLFYTDKLIYIKGGYLNHLVTNKHTWDMLPEIVYELSYIEGKNVIKYTWEVTDDIYYRGKDIKSLGVDNAVDAEKWFGTYTDENGVTYQVYTKTIYIPALAGAAGATTYPHGITNIKQILSAYGFTTDGFVLNAPRQNVADNISIYQVQKAGGIVIEVGKDRSNKKAYVTLVYAKNN